MGKTTRRSFIGTTAAATNRIDDVALDGGAKGSFAPKKPIKLSKGDMIVVGPDYRESQGIGSMTIDSFKVKLIKSVQGKRTKGGRK